MGQRITISFEVAFSTPNLVLRRIDEVVHITWVLSIMIDDCVLVTESYGNLFLSFKILVLGEF